MVQMSFHSHVRASQRRITEEEIEYILQFGKRYYCDGALVYYLRRKDLPASDRRRGHWTNLVGTSVFLSIDRQTVITVWRNRKKGLKWLRMKPGVIRRKFRDAGGAAGFEDTWPDWKTRARAAGWPETDAISAQNGD